MYKLIISIVLVWWCSLQAVYADKPMIVVELFTSQGCSSCPPADDIFAKISKFDDVIGLGFHVDYWDYLGWKDQFARPKFSERQKIYNAVLSSGYHLVTPQMIIQGSSQIVGGSGDSSARIHSALQKLRLQKLNHVNLKIMRKKNTLMISLSNQGKKLGKSSINVVYFEPSKMVKIKKGENHGKVINYANVVSLWQSIAYWDGESDVTLYHKLPKSGSVAVIIQAKEQGRIWAARKLK